MKDGSPMVSKARTVLSPLSFRVTPRGSKYLLHEGNDIKRHDGSFFYGFSRHVAIAADHSVYSDDIHRWKWCAYSRYLR